MTDRSASLEHMLLWSFGLFAFSATFSIAVSQFFLCVSAGLFLVFIIASRHNPFVHSMRLFWWVVAAWITWLLFTGLMGETPLRSMRLSREEWLFVAVLIGSVLLRNENRRRMILTALASGVVLVGVYGMVQYVSGWNLIERHTLVEASGFGWRVLGLFNNYMTFGNFYAVAAAFLSIYTLLRFRAMPRLYRWLFVAASILAILMTLLSFGRGAIAAMVGTIILMLLLLGKKYARISLAVIGVLVVLLFAIPGIATRYSASIDKDLAGADPGGRMFVWKHSIEVIGDYPLLGVGMGNFKDAYAAKLPPDLPGFRRYTHAHNDALNVAAISGIPGLVIFAAMWLTAMGYFWVGYRNGRRLDDEAMACCFAALAGSICFAATSLTEATFVDEEVRALLMLVWAIGMSTWYKGAETQARRGAGQSA